MKKVVLGFPRSEIWLEMEGGDNLEEDDLRNRESNLGPEKVVETAIVEGSVTNPRIEFERVEEEEEEGEKEMKWLCVIN
ncbi:hypothetical protein A2U01_0029754 [Trifolium medium]|uniref:Uncharacterized protein n=1 Tax=Trifolium medium TaxID=97028 RepID=A0A392PBL5_9FABA|nr:hypothetical protein [Trifolium medium]